MCGAVSPLPQYVLMAWCLVKHREKFTVTLPLHGGSHFISALHQILLGLSNEGGRDWWDM
jgi:hypothetical protein